MPALASRELINYIRKKIIEEGPLSFANYMDLALCHPTFGYYNQDTFMIGGEGDFTVEELIGRVEKNDKVGQKVMYKKWGGTEIKVQNEEWTIVSQDDILAVVN